MGNRLCTIKNVGNILGTISKCYVFWRPITLLTVLLKINRTEGGSHVKILTILTRNHLQWSLFSSKVYNFSLVLLFLKKYSTAIFFIEVFSTLQARLFLSNTSRLLLSNDFQTIYHPICYNTLFVSFRCTEKRVFSQRYL